MINLIIGGAGAYEPVSQHEPPESRGSLMGAGNAPAGGGRRMSLREFLDESQASRNPDKITVIGEYLYQHEGKSEFSRDDIKGRFKHAGEGAPANFPRDFSWAVKNGVGG
jgi:hypothetical protein